MLTRIKRYQFNLGAIAITLVGAAIAASPAHSQTTQVPITGGTFTVGVTSAATNNATATAVTVLTPVGTANISALSGTVTGTTVLNNGNDFNITNGRSTGTVNFDTGSTATFTDADTSIKGKITTTTNAGTQVNALGAATATVTGNIQKDSFINVPNTSISALPANTVVVPITGGTFDLVNTNGGPVTNVKTTLLTPFGTIGLTKFEYTNLFKINTTTTSNIESSDQIRATAKASGTAAVSQNQISQFTDANVAVVGTVGSATSNGGVSTSLKGNVTGGSLVVPSSSVTSVPTNTNVASVILVAANPQLFALVSKEPKYFSADKFKFLQILSTNSRLLIYTNSKSSQLVNTRPVSLGDDAVDSLVFLSFRNISIFPVSYEASLVRPVYLVGKLPRGLAKKQRVVFVGMGSRLIPGFGLAPKVVDSDDDDDDNGRDVDSDDDDDDDNDDD